MKKVLLVGGGGRESSLARKLQSEASVYIVMPHKNPTLVSVTEQSKGGYLIGNPADPKLVASYAKEVGIDLAFISGDNPLEAGVVDELMKERIPVVGPTRAGAEIEWSKTYSRTLIQKILPEYNPRYWVIHSKEEFESILKEIAREKLAVVVKPVGLSGGKGVKVMGEHLANYDEVRAYTYDLIEKSAGHPTPVVLEEKLEGIEFTIMGITDGTTVVRAPATYDHPYRYNDDTGPGTGGMGSYCDAKCTLPFITEKEYDECISVIERVLVALNEEGRHFNGVLYGSFFKTPRGMRIIEFNARFGDPECINICAVLDCSLVTLLETIREKKLHTLRVPFKKEASVTKYIVSPDYAVREGKTYEFSLDVEAMEREGVQVLFSAAAHVEGTTYRTVGSSRSVAIAATGADITSASDKIEKSIARHYRGPLDHRSDIGSASLIALLKKRVGM